MLGELFDKHGSDKGSLKHSYHRVYEPALEQFRNRKITLIEIGILGGASLEAWLEYLTTSWVVGVDTFERVRPEDVPVLKHERVKWFMRDTTRDAICLQADVIIDDGDHRYEAQLKTFLNYFPLVKPGGVYFIEDCPPSESKHYARLMSELAPHKPVIHCVNLRKGSGLVEIRK